MGITRRERWQLAGVGASFLVIVCIAGLVIWAIVDSVVHGDRRAAGIHTTTTVAIDLSKQNNVLACTNVDVMFLREAKTQAIEQQNARDALSWGKKAEAAAVRRAATAWGADADGKHDAAVDRDLIAYAEARHHLGMGPGDNLG